MKIKEIKFKRITNFTGRNGFMKCGGVELMESSANSIILSPLTSKGMIGRCDIFIPLEDAKAVAEALLSFVNEKKSSLEIEADEVAEHVKQVILDPVSFHLAYLKDREYVNHTDHTVLEYRELEDSDMGASEEVIIAIARD
jgi:hypothetical protein